MQVLVRAWACYWDGLSTIILQKVYAGFGYYTNALGKIKFQPSRNLPAQSSQ